MSLSSLRKSCSCFHFLFQTLCRCCFLRSVHIPLPLAPCYVLRRDSSPQIHDQPMHHDPTTTIPISNRCPWNIEVTTIWILSRNFRFCCHSLCCLRWVHIRCRPLAFRGWTTRASWSRIRGQRTQSLTLI